MASRGTENLLRSIESAVAAAAASFILSFFPSRPAPNRFRFHSCFIAAIFLRCCCCPLFPPFILPFPSPILFIARGLYVLFTFVAFYSVILLKSNRTYFFLYSRYGALFILPPVKVSCAVCYFRKRFSIVDSTLMRFGEYI